MPVYTFVCCKCMREREVVRPINDRDNPPPTKDNTDCEHNWSMSLWATPTIRSAKWGTKGDMK